MRLYSGKLMLSHALLVICGAFLLTSTALSRPVSYPGGWTVRHQLAWSHERYDMHYSPNASKSIGIVLENSRQYGYDSLSVQWNHLLWRKNTLNTQANLYFNVLTGVSLGDGQVQPHVVAELSADKESRRYYARYHMTAHYLSEFEQDDFLHGLRIGVAPYLGKSGQVHTWFMLDAQHRPEQDDHDLEWVWTPVVRMFYGSYLGEIGIDSNGNTLFNFIIRL